MDPLNILKYSSLRVLIVDHTISFTKFVWFAVIIILCLTNGMFNIILTATLLMYLMSVLVSFMYGINAIQFLGDFPAIRRYYIANMGYLLLLPVYNVFAFFVRLCGIVNSINRKASWKTMNFTEEKNLAKETVKKDFCLLSDLTGFVRRMTEEEEENGVSVPL
jgi:hypothetical protein